MSNSFRIRTEPGVDKSLNVLIDQEFEYLEILSLKLLQSQIYTRQCSDYGVIVGRVSVNNGFGIPNAKVSVFIPLDTNDELNPVTSDLYPYKTLTDLNEDGYRYNLLPYVKSHSGHNPTGTFFNREDVLTDPTLIQVYDKYYKYSTVTNSSGDYMIFGVPTGSQTVVVDIDLSDIGEFSLSPQDLIRMGLATPAQVAGINFKSSTNLNSLPQIINFNRTIEVEPLWGQPEICNLGITRTDFDLSKESGIDIRPTSIFMGSIVSSNDDEALPRNCKPRLKSGSQCTLVTGPGEILAIRQTIFLDAQGKPILETVDLEEGGQVIDDNGTWLVDVPMNLDYLITNEFGEQVISDDPTKGIPTKGKYRFKVKWNQSPSISEPVRRGYFLVPNVKEHGWTTSGSNPNATLQKKSYAFSLDWDDYVDFQSAIDCTDTFYLMQYNKVYTVSQLVDQYRKGYLNTQFIGIKNIIDDSCESENNKFPTNDGVFRFDLIYFLFWIMLFLFRPVFISLIPVIHILWFVLKVVGIILVVILYPLILVVGFICSILKGLLGILGALPFGLGRRFRKLRDKMSCPGLADANRLAKQILEFPDKLKNIKIPNLSYPECSFCDCGDNGDLPKDEPGVEQLEIDAPDEALPEGAGSSLLTPFEIASQYKINRLNNGTPSPPVPGVNTADSVYQTLFAGNGLGNAEDASFVPSTRVPTSVISTNDDEDPSLSADNPEYLYFSSSLTVSERLNLFNTKGKYFNESGSNPGGGVNRIKVTFQPDLNPPTSTTNFHYDNVVAIVCTQSATNLEAGTMLSFQDFALSKDKNVINTGTTLNEYGTNTITGTTINSGSTTNPGTISITYANPDGTSGNQSVSYQIVTFSGDPKYARFPMDVEYFQVITGMTYSEYSGMCNSASIVEADWNNNNSFYNRFLNNDMRFYRVEQPQENQYNGNYNCGKNLSWSTIERYFSPIDYYKSMDKQKVIFLVRGVDPNSSRTKVQYDLSRLFGYNFGNSSTIVTGDEYKLNYPIQGTLNCVNHIATSNLTSDFYFDSFRFEPSITPPDPDPLIQTFGFSAFSSNLHTYYSNLDTTNGGFTPVNGLPTLSSVTLPSSTVSRVVNQYTNDDTGTPFPYQYGTRGWNGFIMEWDIQYTYGIQCFIVTTPYNRRAGTYNVSLIVTDSNGCLDTAVNPQKVTVYDTIPPPVPLAYRVTVEPDNSIRFDFAVYPRPDFGNYIIYKAIAGQPLQIYKYINALNDTVFIDNSVNPDNNSYTYKVVNQSICDRFSSERNSRAHTSILLKGTSDTNATHLFWSAYDGWDKVETYHIYRKEPRKTNFEKIGFVAGTQTTYTDSSAFCDVVYKYYVFAEEDTLSLYHQFSRSNTIALRPLHKETVVPGTIIRATVEDDKNILVEFAPPTAPVTPIELFTLEKSSNGVNYKAVYSTPNCCPSYLDKDVKVHQQSYYYRIKCTDYCADISAPSNIGKSILLGTGINADDNITVDWSAYQHWDDGVKKYELEIQTGSGGFVDAGVNNLTDKDTNYIDTEGDYNYFPKICYRVKATSFNGVISYSNTDCEKGRSSLFVPNAFTPNGDSHNNTFVVVGSYIKTYKIQIFNRYGEKLFTGYSLEDTWDGTFKGEAVQDDAYIYIINAEGIDNKRYNLHGNVTVLN